MIDARDTLVAVVDAGRYSVIVYNHRLQQLYRLERQPSQWQPMPVDTLHQLAQKWGLDVKGFILEARSYVWTRSRIDYIGFLDSKHLLVRYNPGFGSVEESEKRYRRYYDIWRLDTVPVLVAAELEERLPEAGERISRDHFLAAFVLPVCSYPWLVAVRGDAPLDPLGMTYAEYEHRREEYFKDHEPEYVVAVYRLLLPIGR